MVDLVDLLASFLRTLRAIIRKWKSAGLVCGSSFRVPDDSDSKSGVIKQRQNCLESQRVEGQELPVLTLAPCAGKQELNVNQVRRPENRRLAFLLY